MNLANIRRIFFYFFLIVFTVNASVVVWLALISAQAPHIELSSPRFQEVPVLCPGEFYPYTFTVEVDRASTIELSYTVTSDSSIGGTNILLEQYIFDVPGRITIKREWKLPPHFNDMTLGDVSWWSGSTYYRRVQARATGERRVEDELLLPFSIREDCPQ